jgi:hypothetical protein
MQLIAALSLQITPEHKFIKLLCKINLIAKELSGD